MRFDDTGKSLDNESFPVFYLLVIFGPNTTLTRYRPLSVIALGDWIPRAGFYGQSTFFRRPGKHHANDAMDYLMVVAEPECCSILKGVMYTYY